jgi:DNA modification methylase
VTLVGPTQRRGYCRRAAASALPRNQILLGDALDRLRQLPSESVDCVMTSPPYHLLRDYGIEGQLGDETRVEDYVTRLVAVIDEIARVLARRGSLWLNLGDSYSRDARYGAARKSLLLAPERVALQLVARGWILRNKVVWAKPNPLPHSVTDRLTCSWEYLFHLVRAERYVYELDAVRVPHTSAGKVLTALARGAKAKTGTLKYTATRPDWAGPLAGNNSGLAKARADGRPGHRLGKNPGDVWTIPTARFAGSHFAVFPEALVERPLRATCPTRLCSRCERPWKQQGNQAIRPVCGCKAPWRRGLVLDPFIGSGTTAVVAERLQRDWLGIELNPAYRALALERIENARRSARSVQNASER